MLIWSISPLLRLWTVCKHTTRYFKPVKHPPFFCLWVQLLRCWPWPFGQVAIKKFVDDFSVLAVEKCLLKRLAEIFSPHVVYKLADSTVGLIASEDTRTTDERHRLQVKMARMQRCVSKLHRLDRYHLSGEFLVKHEPNKR